MKVKTDLQGTVNDRAVFQGFNELVRENESWIAANEGLLFYKFIVRSYVARVALGIRRHVKYHDDSLSLVRILVQMRDCASQLTLEFYRERFPSDSEDIDWQALTFRAISDDGIVASASKVDSDIARIEQTTAAIEEFTDKTLAHLDKRGYEQAVTFNDLDAAIDSLDEVACRYITVLTGRGYTSLAATIQFDWKKIFSVPWVKPPRVV